MAKQQGGGGLSLPKLFRLGVLQGKKAMEKKNPDKEFHFPTEIAAKG